MAINNIISSSSSINGVKRTRLLLLVYLNVVPAFTILFSIPALLEAIGGIGNVLTSTAPSSESVKETFESKRLPNLLFTPLHNWHNLSGDPWLGGDGGLPLWFFGGLLWHCLIILPMLIYLRQSIFKASTSAASFIFFLPTPSSTSTSTSITTDSPYLSLSTRKLTNILVLASVSEVTRLVPLVIELVLFYRDRLGSTPGFWTLLLANYGILQCGIPAYFVYCKFWHPKRFQRALYSHVIKTVIAKKGVRRRRRRTPSTTTASSSVSSSAELSKSPRKRFNPAAYSSEDLLAHAVRSTYFPQFSEQREIYIQEEVGEGEEEEDEDYEENDIENGDEDGEEFQEGEEEVVQEGEEEYEDDVTSTSNSAEIQRQAGSSPLMAEADEKVPQSKTADFTDGGNIQSSSQ